MDLGDVQLIFSLWNEIARIEAIECSSVHQTAAQMALLAAFRGVRLWPWVFRQPTLSQQICQTSNISKSVTDEVDATKSFITFSKLTWLHQSFPIHYEICGIIGYTCISCITYAFHNIVNGTISVE